jgi:NSS family neurotransmitter:Na+ symporter
LGDVPATVRFLFQFDFAHFTARAAIEALGLGFFSIGVGLSLMITYAAYAPEGVSLKEVAIVSAVADTAISFLAGFAVFPIVFSHGLDPASGRASYSCCAAFADAPSANIAIAFFVYCWSRIGIGHLDAGAHGRDIAPPPRMVAAARPSRRHCFAAGLSSVFSFNIWSGWHPLAAFPTLAQATVFDLLDELTSNVLLPLGGFALAIFAGWALPPRILDQNSHIPRRRSLAAPPAALCRARRDCCGGADSIVLLENGRKATGAIASRCDRARPVLPPWEGGRVIRLAYNRPRAV